MKTRPSPTIVVSGILLALAGCAAGGNEPNFGRALQESFNKAVQKTMSQQRAAGAEANNITASYLRLTETRLKDLFKAYPVKDDAHPPSFPKVAIRITSFSKTLEFPEVMRNTPDECVTYTATLWMSTNQSEKFENLRMCTSDLVFGTSFVTVRSTWPAKLNYNRNSGQVRDDGPVAPKVPYPAGNPAQNFIGGSGVYFLGSMFSQLGYDWNYPHDTMRVWVTSVSH